ncbi:MAG: VWA domain-containing protein, partial [Gammaproteobacteria bacterium]
EVFLFASELVRVTNAWRETEWRDLTAGLTSAGGGTRLGDSLETLQTDYAYCLTGNKVTTIILSDGLDAGDPVLVARNMGALARRSHRVIWLNPLLTTDGYEPIARGMAAALPFVDVFAPAEGIASLWRLVRVLREAA